MVNEQQPTLREKYQAILLDCLIKDGLKPERRDDGTIVVDLSHYNKEIKAAGCVKDAIHGTTLHVTEAVENFMNIAEKAPNFHCVQWTNEVYATHGKEITGKLERYWENRDSALAPERNALIDLAIKIASAFGKMLHTGEERLPE